MANRQPDETEIRQYLLGRLDASSKIPDSIDEHMLANSEFSELVDAIEDEIFYDYLEGSLDPAERTAVEKYFLRPPERREKLHAARILSRRLASASIPKPKIPTVDPAVIPSRQNAWTRWSRYGSIAAAILLVPSIFYSVRLSSVVTQQNGDLAKERESAASLSRQVQDLSALRQPATAMLSLNAGDLRRSGEPAQKPRIKPLQIGRGTQVVHLEVVLPNGWKGSARVSLMFAGKQILSETQDIYMSEDSSILLWDLHAQDLEAGDYTLIVHPAGSNSSEQKFDIHVSRLSM